MKRWISILLLFILIISFPIEARAIDKNIAVKVGPTGSKANLESNSGFIIEQGGTKKIIQDSIVEIKANNNQLIVSSSSARYNINPGTDYVYSQDGKTKYSGTTYRGKFYFLNQGGKVAVVNYLPIDDYLMGVIGKEIGFSSPLEVLKVQAIISRNFALANYDKYSKYGYNLDDSTNCQVYIGVDGENEAIQQAVKETEGLVILYNGEFANTIFHATSGGRTEAIEEVWGGNPQPYLISREDPYSVNCTNATWDLTLTEGEIRNSLGANIGTINAIEISSFTSSGRAAQIIVHGSNGTKTYSGNAFRMKIGPTRLKSTDFAPNNRVDNSSLNEQFGKKALSAIRQLFYATGLSTEQYEPIELPDFVPSREPVVIKPINGSFNFSGRGYGHGVGLSQYGAINMVNDGKNYKEILEFYYPGTELQQLY